MLGSAILGTGLISSEEPHEYFQLAREGLEDGSALGLEDVRKVVGLRSLVVLARDALSGSGAGKEVGRGNSPTA